MSDLTKRLQALGDGDNDDLEIAHEAREEIIDLRLEIERLRGEVEQHEKARKLLADLAEGYAADLAAERQRWRLPENLIKRASGVTSGGTALVVLRDILKAVDHE